MSTTGEPCWRAVSLSFVDIGRSIAEIEDCLRSIRATGTVSDIQAFRSVVAARTAARKLVRSLDELFFEVNHPEKSE